MNKLSKGRATTKDVEPVKTPWVTRVVEGLTGRARLDDE
jgi:hypothetical protein